MYIGMLTDYVSVEFCNGPALASQSFRRNMEERGHQVSLVGPRPVAREAEGDALLFKSLRFRQYATTALAMPWPRRNFTDCPPYDVIHAHSNSLSMHWALMMRHMHGIPCLQTNTIHLPAFAHHAVPDGIAHPLHKVITPFGDRQFDPRVGLGRGSRSPGATPGVAAAPGAGPL